MDVTVLQRAGRDTPGLITQGLELVRARHLGGSQLVLQAAQAESIPGEEQLATAVSNLTREPDVLEFWGCELGGKMNVFRQASDGSSSLPATLTEFLVRSDNRIRALSLLGESFEPTTQALLQFRIRTNTVIFSASESASGQALDAAISLSSLLVEARHVTLAFDRELGLLAADANRGRDPQRLEQALLDLLSLGQRLNWDQLAAFIGNIEDAETLRHLVNQVRQSDDQLPVLFAAIQLSEQPADVAKYLTKFSRTGLADLGKSLRFGGGGVKELLGRGHRPHSSALRSFALGYDPFGSFIELMAACTWRNSGLALTLKWLFYLASGFSLAMAVHVARPPAKGLEEALQVRGFHLAREFLFALGFLLVVLLLSEPFLAQESQKVEIPFRLRLPMVGNAVTAGSAGAHASFMNQMSLLTLLLFFVIQSLIYTACRVKLAEIRRQKVTARIKLKLLENEDHLFDAGLYLGFVGTIISLILVSLGIIKPSLMAAYSSTSFGIIFVSAFKIFNVRPLRRKLLLEAEAAGASDTLS